jgi:hypothetical protein
MDGRGSKVTPVHAQHGTKEASIGEVIPGSDGYTSFGKTSASSRQQTYDEATRKGEVVKRRHPKAKVEIQYSGVTVELK